MIVILEDKTRGYIYKPAKIGDFVTVETHDENGMLIEKSGIVAEILEN